MAFPIAVPALPVLTASAPRLTVVARRDGRVQTTPAGRTVSRHVFAVRCTESGRRYEVRVLYDWDAEDWDLDSTAISPAMPWSRLYLLGALLARQSPFSDG